VATRSRIRAAPASTSPAPSVFDGADSSQVVLWTAHADRASTEHVHDFDECVLVIEGRCAVILGSERIEVRAGQELLEGLERFRVAGVRAVCLEPARTTTAGSC
jgi:quercetin dioxygenase-like cupin family protein